jgi:serine/threonine protein phosphatase PrpC
MAFISGTNLYTCHVGDARCYVLSQGKIKQITTDHTVAAESPEIMHNRNVVTRVIGYSFPEPPEFNKTSLQEGDRVLLCSDGLWSMVDDKIICNTIEKAKDPEEASKHLIAIANQAGGSDNITALIVFCG